VGQLLVDNQNTIQVETDESLSSESDQDDYVQIQPQAASIQLRPGTTGRIQFKVAKAKDYPVDLYFLMDLSWSMRSSRDNLAQLGKEIMEGIKQKTKALATGFGSFVEKNLPPFSSAVPEFNCRGIPNCNQPYSFHHKASLADITAEDFKKAVTSTPLAGNVDDPEGALDALMQVMVCEERIRWRPQSRRFIVLATDRDFHWALDGRLAGILTPNDGRCHLNQTDDTGAGYYTMGERLDYPSVSHISSVAQDGNFNIVFAIKKDYESAYKALASEIPGQAHVAVLEPDATNIINVVEGGYEGITTSIQVGSLGTNEKIGVQFLTDCNQGGPERPMSEWPGGKCQGIPLGTPVTFTAEVNVSSCLKTPQALTIFPVGISGETLNLTLTTACQCDCGQPQINSPQCSGAGSLTCGICECEDPHYGERCQCSGEGRAQDEEACRRPGDDEGAVCSGRGSCSCGLCRCQKSNQGRIYGSYCECDDFSCPLSQGRVCGGRGDCECKECVCQPGWSGAACNCQESTDPCLVEGGPYGGVYDGLVCAGHGTCRCGECICDPVDTGTISGNQYVGEKCETDPTGEGPCRGLKPCVECQAFGSGPLKEDCQSSCPTFHGRNFTIDTKEVEDLDGLFEASQTCSGTNDAGCTFTFSYRMNTTGLWAVLHTRQGESQRCPDLVMPLSLGAGALVLLLGLLSILFYKCYIVIDDRRQYARFQSEAQLAKFGINQSGIYKSPITRTVNPMYGK